jgi:hypothetical protein
MEGCSDMLRKLELPAAGLEFSDCYRSCTVQFGRRIAGIKLKRNDDAGHG